jgi:transposase
MMPPGLQQALGPVLQQIAEMTLKIKQYGRQIQLLTHMEYPETQAQLKVQGVGYITALTFVLTLNNEERFGRSVMSTATSVYARDAVSPESETHNSASPRLATSISDSLLIKCANHILLPHGRDS